MPDPKSAASESTPKAPVYTAPARIKAILDELERATSDYINTQKEFEVSRVHFHAARERFASVKRIASQIMGPRKWWDWQEAHQHVRYAGMMIGEAIIEVLIAHAFQAADSTVELGAKFSPEMTTEEIVDALEIGGFEFRGGAPARETHGALMRLRGVKRDKKTGKYHTIDADEILGMAKGEGEPEIREEEAAS